MAIIHNLGETNSVFNQFVAELRSVEIQTDRMRFRRNLERIGEIFAYEISKTLEYQPVEITTPLGAVQMMQVVEQPLLATILRAGLPLHQGLLNYFDRADNAFITAYRKYHKNQDFTIRVEYISSPSVEGKVLILNDPMLATGASIVKTVKGMLAHGKPKHIHIAAVLASNEGLEYIKRNLSLHNITLWLGGVDDELTAQAYIVPGLGDAGDLAFGQKD
ncbi:MAG: uracil phosphoribosyltransferase [Bacteroidales bacterium]|jgi:uracil phosphoribosyltransferase|nr:uracil phosphoribosyltransferase [Bacteroidales bacterium]